MRRFTIVLVLLLFSAACEANLPIDPASRRPFHVRTALRPAAAPSPAPVAEAPEPEFPESEEVSSFTLILGVNGPAPGLARLVDRLLSRFEGVWSFRRRELEDGRIEYTINCRCDPETLGRWLGLHLERLGGDGIEVRQSRPSR